MYPGNHSTYDKLNLPDILFSTMKNWETPTTVTSQALL